MNNEQINRLDDLTFNINCDLAILNSAVNNADKDLEVYLLGNFVDKIYEKSQKIRNIFEDEIL